MTLLTSALAPIGGAERALVDLAIALSCAGWRVRFVTLYDGGDLPRRLEAEGVTYSSCRLRRKTDVGGWLRLWRVLRAEASETLYVNHQPATIAIGCAMARLARVPKIVAAVHYTHPRSGARFVRFMNRHLMHRMIHTFVVLSPHLQRVLHDRDRVEIRRIRVIPNGISVEKFERVEPAKLHGLTPPVYGLVCALRPEKNVDLYLRAARLVEQRLPACSFVVVGDGPCRDDLVSSATALGIKNITFLGHRDDVASVMSACDVGVLSSDEGVEALPLAVMEFMACGVPVVATRVGAVGDLVVDSVTGLLVDPGDAEGLADAMVELASNRRTRRQMGRRAFAHILENYSFDRTLRLSEQLLGGLATESEPVG